MSRSSFIFLLALGILCITPSAVSASNSNDVITSFVEATWSAFSTAFRSSLGSSSMLGNGTNPTPTPTPVPDHDHIFRKQECVEVPEVLQVFGLGKPPPYHLDAVSGTDTASDATRQYLCRVGSRWLPGELRCVPQRLLCRHSRSICCCDARF